MLQTTPQNLQDIRGEKGPSTFDITQVLAFSVIQEVPGPEAQKVIRINAAGVLTKDTRSVTSDRRRIAGGRPSTFHAFCMPRYSSSFFSNSPE